VERSDDNDRTGGYVSNAGRTQLRVGLDVLNLETYESDIRNIELQSSTNISKLQGPYNQLEPPMQQLVSHVRTDQQLWHTTTLQEVDRVRMSLKTFDQVHEQRWEELRTTHQNDLDHVTQQHSTILHQIEDIALRASTTIEPMVHQHGILMTDLSATVHDHTQKLAALQDETTIHQRNVDQLLEHSQQSLNTFIIQVTKRARSTKRSE
jgi:hypothetical protein